MKIASIDIGTNTCNLLVAEYFEQQNLSFLHKEKRAITLINNKDYTNQNVSKESVNKLIKVVNDYKGTVDNFGAKKLIVTATSGIRSANNKQHILSQVHRSTGIDIDVIDGNREAELVFSGVRNAIRLDNIPVLIIDIGGGSIEFVIANKSEIIWKSSYQIGVARLLNKHHFSDPLSSEDIETIYSILDETLSDLLDFCKTYKINRLVGSSGSYETFADLIKYEFNDDRVSTHHSYNILDMAKFSSIHKKLITLDIEQRKIMLGMEPIRVKMIPIASVITKYLIEKLDIKIITQSNYSIKEGLIFDYIRNNV